MNIIASILHSIKKQSGLVVWVMCFKWKSQLWKIISWNNFFNRKFMQTTKYWQVFQVVEVVIVKPYLVSQVKIFLVIFTQNPKVHQWLWNTQQHTVHPIYWKIQRQIKLGNNSKWTYRFNTIRSIWNEIKDLSARVYKTMYLTGHHLLGVHVIYCTSYTWRLTQNVWLIVVFVPKNLYFSTTTLYIL